MADETTGDTLNAPAAAEGGSATNKLREEASKLGSQAAERARALGGVGKENATGALVEFAKKM